MENLEVKSFLDLIAEVRSRGICGACGGCVSFCSAGQLNALRFGEDGTGPTIVLFVENYERSEG